MNATQVSPHAESRAHAKTILLKVTKVLLWFVYAWVVIVLVLLFLLFNGLRQRIEARTPDTSPQEQPQSAAPAERTSEAVTR